MIAMLLAATLAAAPVPASVQAPVAAPATGPVAMQADTLLLTVAPEGNRARYRVPR